MTHPSDWPVPDPIFGRILANDLTWRNAEAKPQVAPTFTRCSSDWRRPDGYWRCAKPMWHFGRHVYRDAQGKRMPWRTTRKDRL